MLFLSKIICDKIKSKLWINWNRTIFPAYGSVLVSISKHVVLWFKNHRLDKKNDKSGFRLFFCTIYFLRSSEPLAYTIVNNGPLWLNSLNSRNLITRYGWFINKTAHRFVLAVFCRLYFLRLNELVYSIVNSGSPRVSR